MRCTIFLLTVALVSTTLAASPPPEVEYPKIKNHGGVFRVPGKPELPRKRSKVVVDVTSGEQEEGINRGFSRAARFVNLFALGGVQDFEMAVVLHGAATKEALSDEAYTKLFGQPNPNRDVIRQLRAAGAKTLVCGQALTHAGYEPAQVDAEVEVVLSAATAVINRQVQGFGYLAIE